MKLTLGFSPCPNDTFIFDAMIHGKIDTEGLTFDCYIEDVETLNRRAFSGDLDVTKLSFHALGHVLDRYQLLHSGSALGHGCGPLLISREIIPTDEVAKKTIAIPGKLTTAFLLLKMAFPAAKKFEEMVFSEIEDALLRNDVDAGLIIHENRFTYEQKGLQKIMDLGEFWESKTGLPIPLGGIAVQRSLPSEMKAKIDRVLHRSVAFANAHPESSSAYIKSWAQEMNDAVIRQHIQLYVNAYSLELGDIGKKAIQFFFDEAVKKQIIKPIHSDVFLN